MQERLQKIIARAGIASRRHAELLISSGQVLVNGRVVTELGTKADSAVDRIEAAGKVIGETEKPVYIVLNKPPEVMSTLADPEGRKTLRNLLRGFPLRVYPVGNLEYAASGLIFLTNDGDLAAEMIKQWSNLEQVYHIKVKGMLSIGDLDRLGKEIGVKMQTLRQPDATRGHAANYWYEVVMRDSKKEALRNILFKEMHPLEKMKRVVLGPLTVEGIPRGRYRMLDQREIEALKAGKFAERAKPLEVKRETPESILRDQREKALKKNFKPYVKPVHRHAGEDHRESVDEKEDYEGSPSQDRRKEGAFAPFGGPVKQKEAPFRPSAKPGKWKGGARSSGPAHGKRGAGSHSSSGAQGQRRDGARGAFSGAPKQRDGSFTGRPQSGGRGGRPGGDPRHSGPARSGGNGRPGGPGRTRIPGRKFTGRPPKKFTPRG
jgi:23S rRNA pseudouridine2605 synthase